MAMHLVIGDPHAKPNVSNDRFSWLGNLIVDRKPDSIICIGDLADMESLCSYDKGKKAFEGRRYRNDIVATIDAQEKLFAPLKEYNKRMKETKHKQYNPDLYLTLGNHEYRINRAVELQPELEGTISIDDLQYDHFGWSVVDYMEPVLIDGVCYSHFFTSGVMGRPISGEHPGYSLITKRLQSCVQGHVHTRDFCERTTATGKKLIGLVVGCYLDKDQYEAYAGEANKMWWKGVVILHDVQDGSFEPEWINIDQVKERYESR